MNPQFLNAGALETAVLTSANFALIATDEAGVIQLFNVGAQRMLGYTADEVLNRMQPGAMFDPAEAAVRAIALSAEMGVPISPGFESLTHKASRDLEDVYEMTYVCRDGGRLPVTLSTTALRDAGGAVIGYLLIGTDNSASQRAEAALKEAMHSAETANNAKTDFLSRMSHELRTPLNAILGFAQLLESGTPKLIEAQQDNVDQILKAGWFLLALINEVLDLSMVESGTLVLSYEPVSVVEVMQECESMMAPQAANHGVRIVVTAPDTAYQVLADRVRLKQVLINLLTNAIKYNRRGGVVLVDFLSSADARLRIHIRDSGDGMSPAQLSQLFEPFNRLGKEGSAEEGTGIGLVVAKHLIEMMKGQIGVESTVGTGTVFWVDLPLVEQDGLDADAGAGASGAAGAPHTAPPRFNVLYVEDNPANLALVEQLLARRSDLRFMGAADARIGIAYVRSHLPDVVLMDVHLPGLSGTDAMRILRGDVRTAHIPVIAVSANAIAHDIEQALEAGFTDYITKPIRVSSFMRALDQALANRSKDGKLQPSPQKNNE